MAIITGNGTQSLVRMQTLLRKIAAFQLLYRRERDSKASTSLGGSVTVEVNLAVGAPEPEVVILSNISTCMGTIPDLSSYFAKAIPIAGPST